MRTRRWWVLVLCVGCNPPPLPTVAIEPGPTAGVERVTVRMPSPAASPLAPISLLCDERGPSGRRCEPADLPAPKPPAPAPSPPPPAAPPRSS